jgi:UPF0755 protein
LAKSKSKKRKGPHPAPVIIIIIVILAAGGWFGFNKIYSLSLQAMAPGDDTPISVEIPAGAGADDIGRILEENGLIRKALFFRLHSRQEGNDGQYRQGVYDLTKSMTVDEIMAVLIKGTFTADVKRFTIPEGYNITQVRNKLVEAGIVTAEDFMNEIRNGVFDYAFLADCPAGDDRLEGFLYPETYEVYANATAHDVIGKMLSQFDLLFKAEYHDRAGELGRSVRDIVTMGSIVERESVTAEERPLMAGVFYNRLDIDMKLESCATIQYILGESKEFLTYDDLAIESPYNTYLHEGLPPGPICSPRMASIEAALYPSDNDYIFFVLSGNLDGTHNFSADYNKFLKDKDAYYAAVDARD